MRQLRMPRMHPWHLYAAIQMLLLNFATGKNIDFEMRAPALPEAAGKEAYLCMTRNLPNQPLRLVEIHALAKKEVVHHILLFGCSHPANPPKGDELTAWECLGQSTCHGGMEEIVFGWGKDAPPLVYPQDIGLAVGPGSAIKYIVAQVHYLKGQPEGDNSGVRLVFSPEPGIYGAGLLSYASGFTIPPRTPSYLVNNTCCYRGWEPLTAFAMRVHTHDLGTSVWLERHNKTIGGPEKLAEVDPQLPQFFYNVTRHQLWPGQQLRAVCDFNSSTRNKVTHVGATHEFEMCNLYLMLYSRLPFVAMCTGNLRGGLGMPGALDQGYTLVRDPTNFNPPAPESKGVWGDVAGDVTSAASAADGSVWVLHRGNHHWQASTFTAQNVITSKLRIAEKVVMQLDAETGQVLQAWGSEIFSMPHMMNIDKEGNVWITDVGLHQVLKFSPKGKQLLAVGTEWQPGSDEAHFCKPADVAVLLDGSFVVADGYCNNRVVKFDADGKFVAAGDLPSTGDLVVHSIMVDECRGVILAAHREAGKLHMLDLNTLKLKGTYDLSKYGKVWSVNMGPYGSPLVMTWTEGKPLNILQLSSEHHAPPARTTPELVMSANNEDGALPNDFAVGAASTNLTGAGSRLMAFFIAKTCKTCGPLSKWVAAPEGFKPVQAITTDKEEQGDAATEEPQSKDAAQEDGNAEGENGAEDKNIIAAEAGSKGAAAGTEEGAKSKGEEAAQEGEAATTGTAAQDQSKGDKAAQEAEADAKEAVEALEKEADSEEEEEELETEAIEDAMLAKGVKLTDKAAGTDGGKGDPAEEDETKDEAQAADKGEAADVADEDQGAGSEDGQGNATDAKNKPGGVELSLQPEKPKPLSTEEKATKAVLTKLSQGNGTSTLPVGEKGSDKITQASQGTDTANATSGKATGTTSSNATGAAVTKSGEDPAIKAAADAWKKEESMEDYDADYGEYEESVETFEKIAATTAAALLVSEHHVEPEPAAKDTDLVVVSSQYTTRQGSNAVQVILVACVIAVFLAVFAINTLGSMKARVYHPVSDREDSLPVVQPKSSPFMIDTTKPAHRRRAG